MATTFNDSNALWSYEYSPYRAQDGKEIPAFEIFDARGNKVFDTNEDTPADQQEANAKLATAAPELRSALQECVRLLADYDEAGNEEGAAFRRGVAALSLCS